MGFWVHLLFWKSGVLISLWFCELQHPSGCLWTETSTERAQWVSESSVWVTAVVSVRIRWQLLCSLLLLQRCFLVAVSPTPSPPTHYYSTTTIFSGPWGGAAAAAMEVGSHPRAMKQGWTAGMREHLARRVFLLATSNPPLRPHPPPPPPAEGARLRPWSGQELKPRGRRVEEGWRKRVWESRQSRWRVWAPRSVFCVTVQLLNLTSAKNNSKFSQFGGKKTF